MTVFIFRRRVTSVTATIAIINTIWSFCRCEGFQAYRLTVHTAASTGWTLDDNNYSNFNRIHGKSRRRTLELSQSALHANKIKSKNTGSNNNTNNKSKSGNSVSGGFGKAPVSTAASTSKQRPKASTKVDQDYSVFPELDPQVAETLIPSPLWWSEEADLLPLEIYDRLDQIYGFPNFNYEKKPTGPPLPQEDPLSFTDLLSASTTSPPSSSASDLFRSGSNSNVYNNNNMSDTDFADLLALTTDCNSKISTTSRGTKAHSDNTKAVQTMEDDIAKLPPFDKFRVLHVDPLVLAIDDFFTDAECDKYVEMSLTPNTSQNDDDDDSRSSNVAALETKSKTVGKDAAAKSQRTSTTWFHHYERVPELMAKASRLIGLDGITRWEEPQTVRYRRNEKFTWHLDALSPLESTPDQGGQRTATLLVYLKEMLDGSGGATVFRDLTSSRSRSRSSSDGESTGGPLKVRPKKGTALLFFPAAGGLPNTPFDIRTLHCGEVVDSSSTDTKFIAQLWLRQEPYTPTAPPGNSHGSASAAISRYCGQSSNS